MTLIKSISGIRGTIGGPSGEGLTPFDIVKFTAAFGQWIIEKSGKKKIVIGRDARISGEMVRNIVVGTLQGLGIDPRSGLNVLDMINLSLNFLEVAVMNMFARKDNVDLGHVGKITKSMAELQSTMQDMIDDGIDVGSGQRPQPINQPQAPQAQQATQQAASPVNPQVGLANYSPTDSVGKIMDFTNTSSGANTVGSGVALASSNINFVWASKDGKREVFASSNTPQKSNRVLNFTKSILDLKNTLADSVQVQSSIDKVIKIANERNKKIEKASNQKDKGTSTAAAPATIRNVYSCASVKQSTSTTRFNHSEYAPVIRK